MNTVLKSSDISHCWKVRIAALWHESGGCWFVALGTKPSPGSAQLSDPAAAPKGRERNRDPVLTEPPSFFILKIGGLKNKTNTTNNN